VYAIHSKQTTLEFAHHVCELPADRNIHVGASPSHQVISAKHRGIILHANGLLVVIEGGD
jgi:hypothetical protein